MAPNVAIGIQDFSTIIENKYFYIDKTAFLKEWWDSGDSVTLITRPRRFGKTLTMSMTEQFFRWNMQGVLIYLRVSKSGKIRSIASCRELIRSSVFHLPGSKNVIMRKQNRRCVRF